MQRLDYSVLKMHGSFMGAWVEIPCELHKAKVEVHNTGAVRQYPPELKQLTNLHIMYLDDSIQVLGVTDFAMKHKCLSEFAELEIGSSPKMLGHNGFSRFNLRQASSEVKIFSELWQKRSPPVQDQRDPALVNGERTPHA